MTTTKIYPIGKPERKALRCENCRADRGGVLRTLSNNKTEFLCFACDVKKHGNQTDARVMPVQSALQG